VDHECRYDDSPPHDSGRIEDVRRKNWPGSFGLAPLYIWEGPVMLRAFQDGCGTRCTCKIDFM
jgi:hypothetical protein